MLTRALEHVLATLAPYLDEIVLVGGWAHRFHAADPRARARGLDPLATFDVDVDLPETLAPHGVTLRERLLSEFRETIESDSRPPACRYAPIDATSEIHAIDFVTPRQGSSSPARVARTIGGVGAWMLPHVDLLLVRPWIVDLVLPTTRARVSLRVAHPTAYLTQKILVLAQRGITGKHGKDALYVHDTLKLFGHDFSILAAEWDRIAREMAPGTRRKLRSCRATLESTSSTVLAAVAIARAQGRAPISAEEIALVCRTGLGEIFDR